VAPPRLPGQQKIRSGFVRGVDDPDSAETKCVIIQPHSNLIYRTSRSRLALIVVAPILDRSDERLDGERAKFDTLVPFSFSNPIGDTDLILARPPSQLLQRTCRRRAHTTIVVF
jgi:hypothetical protein